MQGRRDYEDSVDALAERSAQALRTAGRIPEAMGESEHLVAAAPSNVEYLIERASTWPWSGARTSRGSCS